MIIGTMKEEEIMKVTDKESTVEATLSQNIMIVDIMVKADTLMMMQGTIEAFISLVSLVSLVAPIIRIEIMMQGNTDTVNTNPLIGIDII